VVSPRGRYWALNYSTCTLIYLCFKITEQKNNVFIGCVGIRITIVGITLATYGVYLRDTVFFFFSYLYKQICNCEE